MEALWEWIQRNILNHLTPPKNIEIIDIIQIILIAFFVYRLIVWVKDTRAYALTKGILFIVGFVIIAYVARMDAIIWILNNFSVVAITAIVIVFQPELRKVLEQVGHKNPITALFSFGRFNSDNKAFSDKTIIEIVRAVSDMAELRTGALIVLEQNIKLEEVADTGIAIDAVVSCQLLVNIFEHNTPLHDGAVLVRGDRVVAATCYLPLSENMDLSKTLGTRHRAGVGISEISDCIAIIVSEETGLISYANEGRLKTGVMPSDIRELLHQVQSRAFSRRKEKRK